MMLRIVSLVLATLIGMAPFQAAAADETRISYVMKSGDSLNSVARRFLVNTRASAEVQAINRIRDPHRISTGRTILIPRRLLRFEPIVLRVANFSGPVTVSGGAAEKGQALGEGAVIATGVNGFVTLTSAEGSRLSVPSQSRLRVSQARRFLINRAAAIEFDVLQGRAEVTATKQGAGDQFQLKTPAAVSAVRGTVFRVGYDDARQTSFTEVLEGLVGVSAQGNAVNVAKGFGVAASMSGALSQEALLPAPAADSPGRVQVDPQLHFALRTVAGASSYRVQLARDAGFVDVVAGSEFPEPKAEFPELANGRYFMRASAVAASGLEGEAETWSFRRQQVGVKAQAGPAEIPDGFRIGWLAEGEGTSVYHFQMYLEESETGPLIDEPGMRETGITLTSLKPGVYRWRVGVTQTADDGSAQVWMPFQKFTVSPE